jgi:basic membrane protein A
MRFLQAVGILLVLALFVVACGQAPAQEAESSTSSESAQAEQAATSDGPFRVAVVAPSAINDLAFTQSLYDALLNIQQERGEDSFEIAVSEGMFVVDDASAAIRDYAAEGFNLVIAHGSQYGSSLQEIAPDFPETSFAWGTTVETFQDQGINNVFAYTTHSNQGGYVEGTMAALLTESGTVGVIGPISAGDARLTVEGFVKGVNETDPDVQVLKVFTGSFSDVALAAEAAQTQIDAGADYLTGTAQMVVGAVGVAKEEGVKWFGNQASQTSLAPDLVVANQVYDWTVALNPIIESVESGTLGGEVYELTLANGGLVMEYNDNFDLPDEVRAKAEETIQGIIDGSIDTSIEVE